MRRLATVLAAAVLTAGGLAGCGGEDNWASKCTTTEGVVGTWIGSTVGMVAADALAILVGRYLGRHLPEKVIKYGAAALFAIFGIWLIAEAVAELT